MEAGSSRTGATALAAGRAGGGQQPSKRLARSKAACFECHKAKQRCDGPPGPCHRCTTWGIDCTFPSAAGPVVSAKSSQGRSATPPTRAAKVSAATAIASAAVAAPPPPPPAAPEVVVASATPDVAEQLRLMNARLESMEAALVRAQNASSVATSSPSQLQQVLGTPRLSSLNPSLNAQRRASSSQNGSDSSPRNGTGVTPASHSANGGNMRESQDVGVNAVETAGEAMAVEGLVDLSGPGRHGGGGPEQQLGGWDSVRPDVLGRSIMTLEECDAAFDFYFDHLQPWTCLLSSTLDRHPLVVRERSPLLFHAILLLALYYRPRSPGNVILYRAVSSILDSILAPQILCPQPDQLSLDFVRALDLLVMYKPLQWAALNARGVSDPAQIESSSKMNVRASWILRLLVSRVSHFVGLPNVATTFAQAFANQQLTPIPDAVVAQTRLFLGCVFHESHGALQSGKAANFSPQDACRVTRLFAALRRQSSDVRLAAGVELVATASGALLARKEDGVLEDDDLRRFDEELDAWTEYWAPLLEAQTQPGTDGGVDTAAWSLFYPYASFTRLTVRGFAFNKWKAERKERAAQRAATLGGFAALQHHGGGGGAPAGPALGAEERDSIAKAVQVAEEMMCAMAVSPEGKALRSARGKPNGESVAEVWRFSQGEALMPETEVVQTLKWASDSLTCVMFSYPLIFLAKLANEGLLRSDLTVIDAGSSPLPPSPMSPQDKLCRLFQLGADLLESITPNPHHPAVKQAAFLRKVWDAGISGRRSVTSAPSSPNFHPTNPSHVVPSGFSIGAAAAPAAMPPPHPALAAHLHPQHQQHHLLSGAPQPPTLPNLPPLPPTHPHPHSAAPALASYGDFSLSTTYNPTPMHSPPFPPTGSNGTTTPSNGVHGRGLGVPPSATSQMVEDPFAALLQGVSPSVFDGAFSLDGGVDWTAAEQGGLGFGGGGAGGGFSGFQF